MQRATEDLPAIRAVLLPRHRDRALPPPSEYAAAVAAWRESHRGQQKAANAANAWAKGVGHDRLVLTLREGFRIWGAAPDALRDRPWPLQTKIWCDRRFVRRLEESQPMFRQRNREFCWHDVRYIGTLVSMLVAPLVDHPPTPREVLALFDVIHSYMTPILRQQWESCGEDPEPLGGALPVSAAQAEAIVPEAILPDRRAPTEDGALVQHLLEEILRDREETDRPQGAPATDERRYEDKQLVMRRYTRAVLRLYVADPDSRACESLVEPLPQVVSEESPDARSFVCFAKQYMAHFQPASEGGSADPELLWAAAGELTQIANQCIARVGCSGSPRERQLTKNAAQAVMFIAGSLIHQPRR